MKAWGAVRTAAAVFLLCAWGGVLSCSNGNENGGNNEDPNEVHNNVWKINEGKSGFVGASSGSDPNKTHKDYPGYEGAYIDGLGGGYVDYAVHSDEAQDVTILLRYAYWGYKHELRGAQIVVNGKADEDIIYCNWTNGKKATDIWQDSNEITVHLDVGDNALRVVPVPKGTSMPDAKYPDGADETKKTWTADGNLPNIDYLQITGKGLSAASGDIPAYYGVKVSGDFGKVDIEPKQAFYAKDTEITVTATPDDGYRFDAWLGTRASNDAEWRLTVTEELNLAAHFVPMDYKASDAMVGYATITDDNGTKYTITGGAGGKTIEIASLPELKANADKLSGDESYIVYFTSGERITTADNKSEYYTVGSNKTIYGKVKGAGLKNIEMRVTGSNVIIRNMVFGEVIGDDTFGGTGNDALSLNGAKHVWIDHCELFSHLDPKNNNPNDNTVLTWENAKGDNEEEKEKNWKKDFYDGLLDVKNGAAWITVSNCYFHDHWKAVLCGSSDKDENGDRAMRITFVGNYWENINSRQPLFRWGKAHIFNSYFYSEASGMSGESTGINCRAESDVYIDNNYFENIKTPIGYYNDETKSKPGHWVNEKNSFVSCKNAVASSSTTYTPPYTWDPTSAETAKADVVTNAGVGKLSAADLQ